MNELDQESVKEFFDILSDSTTSVEEKTKALKERMIEYGSSANDAAKDTAALLRTFDAFGAGALGVLTGIRELATGLDGFADTVKDSGSSTLHAVTAIASLGSAAGQMTKIFPEAGKLADLFGGIVKEVGTNFAKAADNTKSLENSYMSLLTKSGSMGSIWSAGGAELKDFDAQINNFVNNIYKTQKATTHMASELGNIQKDLGTIPKALTSNVDGLSREINVLTEFTKIMDGTARSAKDVYSDLNFAYDTLGYGGDKAEEALGFISQMSIASETLGIRFETVQKSVEEMATNFQYLGDNTEAAIRILGRMVPALQDVGASPKQAVDMIKQMGDGIKDMTTAERAFLSQRTGGAGGLQGAFQIDQLIAEGKVDEVMEKIQSSFKRQMGGRIVTLAEAAKSPQAAAQYKRQLSFAQSGAFGSQVKNRDQAAKFFKAMAEGAFDAARKQMTGRDDALKTITARGDVIQLRNNNALIEVDATYRNMAQFTEMNMARTVRERIGSESRFKDVNKASMKEAEHDVAKRTPASEAANFQKDTRFLQSGLDLTGTLARYGSAFMSKKEGPEQRPQAPHAAMTTEKPSPTVVAPRGDRARTPAVPTTQPARNQILPPGVVSPHQTRTQNERVNRHINTAMPGATGQVKALHTEAAHAATRTTQAQPPVVQFPSKIAIEGVLDNKCQNCGTNNKSQISGSISDPGSVYGLHRGK